VKKGKGEDGVKTRRNEASSYEEFDWKKSLQSRR